MLIHQTAEKLRSMRLQGMAECLLNQSAVPNSDLSFEERLGLLVDYEYTYRQNRKLARLLKEARLKLNACIEDIHYQPSRGLDKSLLSTLGGGEWLLKGYNVLVTGATGTGKTFIACALANLACRLGFSARYFRLSRLLLELNPSRGDGTYPKLTAKLAKTNILILDDFGLETLTPAQSKDILDIIDDRVQFGSTVVTSQLPLEHWHATISDSSIADAILDRLVHNAYKIFLKGESMRKTKSDLSQSKICDTKM